MDTSALAKTLMLLGVCLLILAALVAGLPKIPFLGKLPGDFMFQSGKVKIFAPIATCILLSLILTVFANLFFGRK